MLTVVVAVVVRVLKRVIFSLIAPLLLQLSIAFPARRWTGINLQFTPHDSMPAIMGGC